LEALPEAMQDTVVNYVNSGMKVNDAHQRTIAGAPEAEQQPWRQGGGSPSKSFAGRESLARLQQRKE